MLRPDSPSRRDILTDFAIGAVIDEGLFGLTVRGLARRIRVTPAGLQHWSGPRREMLVTVAATFGQRWEQWMWRREFRDGALALLPTTPDEVGWTRVWLALQELGRTEEEVAVVISDVRAAERTLVAHSHPELTDDDVVFVLALVDGLRTAVCQHGHLVEPAAARAMLRHEVAARPSAGPEDDPPVG